MQSSVENDLAEAKRRWTENGSVARGSVQGSNGEGSELFDEVKELRQRGRRTDEALPFFSVQRHMALARSLSKPESQLHICKFSELMQWQHHHIDNVHQK